MTQRIYLDSIAAAKPSRGATLALTAYFEERYGSPASCHQVGQELFQDAKRAYERLYALFSVPPESHFCFTSSGAEAVAHMLHTIVQDVVRKEGKNHFVARTIDEAATILSCSALEDEACKLTLANVGSSGYMSLDNLIEAISPRTALISCSLACALTGVIQPIEEVAEFAKQRGILLHIDATHCIGKIPIDFQEMKCDLLTFNGEQFHAPIGTGGIFAKKEIPLRQSIHGGTLNVPFLSALTQAVAEAKDQELYYCTHVAHLRAKLEDKLVNACSGVEVLFQYEARLPHISCMAFSGVKSEALLFALSRKGVMASMGGGLFQHLQRVLEASGIKRPQSLSALTFSLSKDTQESEIDRAVIIIKECVERLRKTSKVYT